VPALAESVAFSIEDFVRYCNTGIASEELSTMYGVNSLVIDARSSAAVDAEPNLIQPNLIQQCAHIISSLPTVLIGLVSKATSPSSAVAALFDVILTEEDEEAFGFALQTLIATYPLAATSLAVHLRCSHKRAIEEGLIAESTLYSLLQSGPEFAGWLASRSTQDAQRKTRKEAASSNERAVLVNDDGTALEFVLNRPKRHNAFSRQMRDELHTALHEASHGAQSIIIRGAGPSFCSGGDLSEFGTFASTVESHLTRLTRSPARLIAQNADQITVLLHGACYGAGIELPAFAHHIVADPDARFCLPELSLGLIPGAGGTVSLPKRIGRQRTALLALSGVTINTTTALEWGLVDAVAPRLPYE
jgi:1,4-dihydroxy-2-naphthoyl-CoA synthase